MIFDGDERYDAGNVDVLQTVSDGYNKPERVRACEFLYRSGVPAPPLLLSPHSCNQGVELR